MVLLNAAWYGFVWTVLMIGYGLNTYRKNSSIFLSTLHGGRRLRGSWYWSLVNVTLITWLKQYLPRIEVGVFFSIYLFLAPLRLPCYVQQPFSSCSKLEPLFSMRASHCCGFSGCRGQALGHKGSVVVVQGLFAPLHEGSSQTRDWTRSPSLAGEFLTTGPQGSPWSWFGGLYPWLVTSYLHAVSLHHLYSGFRSLNFLLLGP